MSKNNQLKKEQFLELFAMLVEETLGHDPNSETDFNDAYETYVYL